jgi:hypothetical protein
MHREPPAIAENIGKLIVILIQKCLSAGDIVAASDFAEVGIFRWQLSIKIH